MVIFFTVSLVSAVSNVDSIPKLRISLQLRKVDGYRGRLSPRAAQAARSCAYE